MPTRVHQERCSSIISGRGGERESITSELSLLKEPIQPSWVGSKRGSNGREHDYQELLK